MNSLYYGLALIAILIIIGWYIANDGNGQNDGSRGLLALRKPTVRPTPVASTKRSFRRQS
jgi:hypothetical protein